MKGCKKMAIFTNQAQLRYGNAVAYSNVAVGEILDLGAYAFGTDTLVPLTYVADTVRYYSNGIL